LDKTQTAQKLIIRVKFTGNLYSYVCERQPLKYTQTSVCRNSYTGTQTVPDSYSCLCERSLRALDIHSIAWWLLQQQGTLVYTVKYINVSIFEFFIENTSMRQ